MRNWERCGVRRALEMLLSQFPNDGSKRFCLVDCWRHRGTWRIWTPPTRGLRRGVCCPSIFAALRRCTACTWKRGKLKRAIAASMYFWAADGAALKLLPELMNHSQTWTRRTQTDAQAADRRTQYCSIYKTMGFKTWEFEMSFHHDLQFQFGLHEAMLHHTSRTHQTNRVYFQTQHN